MDEITVLMSTYNGERYLRAQIDSILSQKGVRVKLAVRDDGSSDGTKGILADYAARGLVTVYSGENMGPALSFMQLIGEVKAETAFYAFADQDDIWLPGKLKRAVMAIGRRRDRPVLYASNQMVTDGEGREIGLRHEKRPPTDLLNIIDKNHLAGCTFVFTRSLMELLQARQPVPRLIRERMHDTWAIAVAAAVGGVLYDERAWMKYRLHGENVVGLSEKPLRQRLGEKLRAAALREEDYHRFFAEELRRLFGDRLRADAAHVIGLYRNTRTLRGKLALLMDPYFRRKYCRSRLSFAAKLLLG